MSGPWDSVPGWGRIRLRQREDQRDRLDLRDVDEAVGIGRVNDVADVDLPDAGHPIDRRGETGVTEIDPRAFDDRLVGFIIATSWSTMAFWESASCVAIDFCWASSV